VLLEEVVDVLDSLDANKVRHWVAGGWGVDFLVGRQTREHRDLDLAVNGKDYERCMSALSALGYQTETDWLPLRIEVRASGARWVDVHPVHFDDQGIGLQGDRSGVHFEDAASAFATGQIGARSVRCLSVSQQLLFHSGYKPRSKDRHDLALLASL
jgi:lincosamide nucleotidyltransferase A/C/D/E